MSNKIHNGVLLDEQASLSLSELRQACIVQTEWVIELVEEGILNPVGDQTADWHFSGLCLQRAQTVRRLQRDLGVNLAGAALAVELLSEIESLRERLRVFDREYS